MTQQSIYPGRGMLRHGLMAVEVEARRVERGEGSRPSANSRGTSVAIKLKTERMRETNYIEQMGGNRLG